MSRARAAFLLLAMFVLGAASGAMGAATLNRLRGVAPGSQGRRIEGMAVRHLARRLDLDADQRAVLIRVTARARNQMEQIRQDSLARVEQILDEAYEELRPTLRPDQAEKLERIRGEAGRRLRWRQGPRRRGAPPERPVN